MIVMVIGCRHHVQTLNHEGFSHKIEERDRYIGSYYTYRQKVYARTLVEFLRRQSYILDGSKIGQTDISLKGVTKKLKGKRKTWYEDFLLKNNPPLVQGSSISQPAQQTNPNSTTNLVSTSNRFNLYIWFPLSLLYGAPKFSPNASETLTTGETHCTQGHKLRYMFKSK